MSSFHETELLIFEIKRRPTIWDNTVDDYKNKVKKNDAWTEVCRILNPKYDEKSDSRKKQILLDLQGRWKSIRDSNNRSKKKRKGQYESETSTSKKYLFADHLAFLQKTNPKTEADESFETYPHEESFPQDEEDEQEDLPRTLSPRPAFSSNNTTIASRKRKLTLEDRMIMFMERFEEKDADKDFFNSILPSVKKLTEDQNLMFRSEVIMALQRVKKT